MVHESVRWLAERGEAKKCVEILKKIARTNGKEVKAEIYDSYEVQYTFSWAESKTLSYSSNTDSIAETCVQTIRNFKRCSNSKNNRCIQDTQTTKDNAPHCICIVSDK